jgi:hypothetical protein
MDTLEQITGTLGKFLIQGTHRAHPPRSEHRVHAENTLKQIERGGV